MLKVLGKVKIDLNSLLNGKIIIGIISVLLIAISFVGFHDDLALSFLEKASKENLESLGIVATLKIVAGAIGSSHIPGVSGASHSISDILSDILKYLSVSNVLISLQIISLKLSQLFLVKCIPVILLSIFLIKKSSKTVLRLLVILLLLSPGLSIFVNVIQIGKDSTNLVLTTEVNQELRLVKEKIGKYKNELNAKLQNKEDKWDKKVEQSKGKHKARLIKAEAFIAKDVDKAVTKTEISAVVTSDYIKACGKLIGNNLVQLVTNSLSTILFIFLLLPLLFWYIIYQFIKRFKSQIINIKMKTITLSIVLLSAVLVFFQCSIDKSQDETKENNNVIPASEQKPLAISKSKYSDTLKLQGVDVSHFNGKVDWALVKKGGVSFAYAKATQGITYIDKMFDANWKNIKDAGVSRGAYHFYVATDDPIEQAKHFISVVKELGKDDLVPMLDLEGKGIGKLTTEKYEENVIKWLKLVEKELGKRPIIYTDNPFANQFLSKTKFADYNLWIAEYGIKKPKIPTAWSSNGALIWQYEANAKVSGINSEVDKDVLYGDLEMIR